MTAVRSDDGAALNKLSAEGCGTRGKGGSGEASGAASTSSTSSAACFFAAARLDFRKAVCIASAEEVRLTAGGSAAFMLERRERRGCVNFARHERSQLLG